MTACRRGEILDLKWENVDFSNAALELADAKGGPRTHPLGAPALAILKSLPREEGDIWVVHGRDPEKRLPEITLRRAWGRLCAQAKIMDAHLHDLRGTFATYAAQT